MIRRWIYIHLIVPIKVWNPSWFINPFYSPGVDLYEQVRKGFEKYHLMDD